MRTVTSSLTLGLGLTATGLTGLGLIQPGESAMVTFLKCAGDLDKYAAKLAEHGFVEVEALADREVTKRRHSLLC